MSEDSTPLLEVEGITFSYGMVQVLFGIDLRVDQGERLALLGTNGAGKSTLLRVISGLEAPSGGHVRFQGVDVTGRTAPEMVREGVVMIPGGRAIFPDMTVEENLDVFALAARGERTELDARRDELFSMFPRLQERLGQTSGTMSGGEQQQLALAKGFLLQPRLLCIDELSLGLSPNIVDELLQAVVAFSERGTTVLLVEQSLNTAATLCERAIFMEKGAIRFEGRTAELLERDDIARAVFLGDAAGQGASR